MTIATNERILAEPLQDDDFAPFGVVIRPTADGTPAGPIDRVLDLNQGRPRFYILALTARSLVVKAITRHHQTTQALASVGGAEWFLLVAPPDPDSDRPAIEALRAFRIPGDVAILMKRGTWHAGPYFLTDTMNFFNLELEDTNIVDHDTCNLVANFGKTFEIAVPD